MNVSLRRENSRNTLSLSRGKVYLSNNNINFGWLKKVRKSCSAVGLFLFYDVCAYWLIKLIDWYKSYYHSATILQPFRLLDRATTEKRKGFFLGGFFSFVFSFLNFSFFFSLLIVEQI